MVAFCRYFAIFVFSKIFTNSETSDKSEILRVNDVFDRVFVINLSLRQDRMFMIQKSLERLNITFERIEAINGNTKHYSNLYDNLKWAFSQYSSPASLGLARTMLRTLRIAKGRGYRRILWLEDDAIFHKDFLSQFDRSMKKIPEDWSVVQFGSTFLKMSHIKKHDGYFTARKPIEGAFAVGIDERAFDDMIRLLELDMGVIDSKVISGACLKRRHHCYYILPFIVVADVRTSDINPRRIKYSPFSRIGKTRQRNSYENERYLVKMGDFYFPDDVCSISLILFIDPALDLQSVSSIMRWSVGQTYKMAEYIFLDFGLSASQKKAVTKFFDNSERFCIY